MKHNGQMSELMWENIIYQVSIQWLHNATHLHEGRQEFLHTVLFSMETTDRVV